MALRLLWLCPTLEEEIALLWMLWLSPTEEEGREKALLWLLWLGPGPGAEEEKFQKTLRNVPSAAGAGPWAAELGETEVAGHNACRARQLCPRI